MHISRILVEEGFLDGLDLQLPAGLNVLIGARGTGKTSIIELLRFCLGATSTSPEMARRSTEHALSILGGGRVAVTLLDDDDDAVIVTRSADDEAPASTGPFRRPIIYSQTEIETVGLSAPGRLQLIDAFTGGQELSTIGQSIVAEIRSLTIQIASAQEEADRIAEEARQIDAVLERLLELATDEARIPTLSADAVAKKRQLDELSATLANNAVRSDHISRFVAIVASLIQEVDGIGRGPGADDWQPSLGPDPLSDERSILSKAKDTIRSQINLLHVVRTTATEKLRVNQSARVPAEELARELRREIEGLEKGAGAVAREAQNLRQRKAQLEEVARILAGRKAALDALVERRNHAMERLELERHQRFRRREQVIAELNAALGPRIRLSIERAGQFDQFASTITEALKGSGVRYGDLAPILAQSVSPRELVEAVDKDSPDTLVAGAGLTNDRALRVLSALRQADLGALATVDIDDDVRLELLDGPHYKDISELSTGQRCTVVLPIVLAHRDRIVVVDQPEDHIDNAFISDTLIKSILNRDSSGQMIFSTHNANIPVLGDAQHVVQMSSDGRRGFAVISAPLESKEVVDAITRVMEGGKEAFQRRARFYSVGGLL